MDERPKRKHWKWMVPVGVVLLLLLAASFAVLFPATPYKFLKGADLQHIELIDYRALMGAPMPAGFPTKVTYRIYTSPVPTKELIEDMRQELVAKGWTDIYAGMGGMPPELGDMAAFQTGTSESIMAYSMNDSVLGGSARGWDDLKGETLVMVTTETTFMDRILDKLHKDKMPAMFPSSSTTTSPTGGP